MEMVAAKVIAKQRPLIGAASEEPMISMRDQLTWDL
jgi:hypothetical protein